MKLLRIIAVLAAIAAAVWWLATDAASQTPPATSRAYVCSGSVPEGGGPFTLDCQEAAPSLSTSTLTNTPTALAASFTPTPTATMTPSPSPSATATPSATAAPTSSSTATSTNSLAQIIADSDERTPHDGALCVPSGYSWAFTSDVQQASPGTYTQGTGWGVFQWPCLNGRTVTSPGVTVSVQNVRAYALGSGGWKQITFSPKWCALTNTETNINLTYDGCPLGGHTGPTWAMPTGQTALHWASDHTTLPAGTVCGVTMYQARTSAGVVLADAGLDWWSGSSNRGAVVGRYRKLTTEWAWINASSCTAAQLTASPPPL